MSWGSNTRTTRSKADGTYLFDLDSLSWGSVPMDFTVRASTAGYQDYEAEVSVSKGDQLTHNIFMVPVP